MQDRRSKRREREEEETSYIPIIVVALQGACDLATLGIDDEAIRVVAHGTQVPLRWRQDRVLQDQKKEREREREGEGEGQKDVAGYKMNESEGREGGEIR